MMVASVWAKHGLQDDYNRYKSVKSVITIRNPKQLINHKDIIAV